MNSNFARNFFWYHMPTLCSLFLWLNGHIVDGGSLDTSLIVGLNTGPCILTQCVKFFMHNYGQHGTLALALEYERHRMDYCY